MSSFFLFRKYAMQRHNYSYFCLEQFVLVFWEEEETCSVVKETNVLGGAVQGCMARISGFRKKTLEGRVAAVGKYSMAASFYQLLLTMIIILLHRI